MPQQPMSFPAGQPIRLSDLDPSYHDPRFTKESAKLAIEENVFQMDHLGHRLHAENRRALLIILQGMDTAGKDGTIRTVMHGVNPQICQVTSFKRPSERELDHDFLWRIHQAVPRRGEIGIFNRSQYEDVLVVRVNQLVPEAEWRSRFDRINEFERLVADGGVKIVKCFLYVGKEEQRKRLQSRLDDPNKRWKFNRKDLEARKQWDEYIHAYEEALTRCNTGHAPWHIIPANRKWYRNLAVSQLVVDTLQQMSPQFPVPGDDLAGIVVT